MIYRNLSSYMTYLLSRGELILSKDAASQVLNISDAALRNSIKRQVQAKHLLPLLRGYYLIIPAEYTQLGIVPADRFIDDLMRAQKINYYVGLLSAASFYGASHQAVQIFQVITDKRLKSIPLGQSKIVFYYNKNLKNTSTQQFKTDRGPLTLSTPESTALDLLKYIHQSGNLNHVATVLSELAESLKSQKLKAVAQNYSVAYAQRLGYLLESLGYGNLSQGLNDHVQEKKPFNVPLRPGKPVSPSELNSKWHLFINEIVESDI